MRECECVGAFPNSCPDVRSELAERLRGHLTHSERERVRRAYSLWEDGKWRWRGAGKRAPLFLVPHEQGERRGGGREGEESGEPLGWAGYGSQEARLR